MGTMIVYWIKQYTSYTHHTHIVYTSYCISMHPWVSPGITLCLWHPISRWKGLDHDIFLGCHPMSSQGHWRTTFFIFQDGEIAPATRYYRLISFVNQETYEKGAPLWNDELESMSREWCLIWCGDGIASVQTWPMVPAVLCGNRLYRPVYWLRVKCTSCRQLSQIEPRTQRPSFRDHGSHFTRKNTRFRARECFHPWLHTLPNCHTSQLLVDGWLTWWCGRHDETWTWWQDCPPTSSVTRRFSN